MKSMIADIAVQVRKDTFDTLMQGPDMSEFFPVQNDQQLLDFMDRTNSEWPARRTEFAHYLFNCVSNSKKAFSKGLLKSLFSREYMRSVKWPTQRAWYFFSTLLILHNETNLFPLQKYFFSV